LSPSEKIKIIALSPVFLFSADFVDRPETTLCSYERTDKIAIKNPTSNSGNMLVRKRQFFNLKLQVRI
jgi:hypothetical protein